MNNCLRVSLAFSIGTAAIAGWAQEMQPAEFVSSTPGQNVAGVFQASFPAYRVRLLEKTELGAVPALDVYGNGQLIFGFH